MDLICSPNGTRILLTATQGVPKHLKTCASIARCWHDLLHEQEYEDVIQGTVDWMDDRLRISLLSKHLD